VAEARIPGDSYLVLGHLALTTKRFLMTEAGKQKSDEESAETNRMMGLALQGQGQLDMAFDRFRRVPMSDAVMDNLYNLALDFERKRQFNKAQAVYEHMAAWNKGYKDLQSKLNRAKNLSETVILGGGGAHPGGTMLLDGGAVEKPMLGRYQVEKSLARAPWAWSIWARTRRSAAWWPSRPWPEPGVRRRRADGCA
jgi:hypothetical protein